MHTDGWRLVALEDGSSSSSDPEDQVLRHCQMWKSHTGRRPIPADLPALIRRMALENPTWGQERIANELLLKLGLRVTSQRWRTFVRSHARAIIACDFCVAVTATFHGKPPVSHPHCMEVPLQRKPSAYGLGTRHSTTTGITAGILTRSPSPAAATSAGGRPTNPGRVAP